jgi:hypothetical protein
MARKNDGKRMTWKSVLKMRDDGKDGKPRWKRWILRECERKCDGGDDVTDKMGGGTPNDDDDGEVMERRSEWDGKDEYYVSARGNVMVEMSLIRRRGAGRHRWWWRGDPNGGDWADRWEF